MFSAVRTSTFVLIGVCGFAVLALLSIASQSSKSDLSSKESILASVSSVPIPQGPATKYSKLTDKSRIKVQSKGYRTLASIDYYPWDYIVEPSRESILEVPDTLVDDGFEYRWKIHAQGDSEIYRLEGASVKFTFLKPTVVYDVELTVLQGDKVVSSQVAYMMCKYVRREIRSLLDEDRIAYFKSLGYVAMGDPKAFEAEAYLDASEKSLQYMMVKHIHSGTCSPFHNGNGFLTSHAAFTLELDQAMQVYDPSVLQPYWDYTIDADLFGNDWYLKSPIFNDDWYGAASPSNDDRHVTTTWIDRIDNPISREAPIHNSFGIVTIASNNNPSTSVTRAHSFCNLENRIPLPTCFELEGCLRAFSIGTIRLCMETLLHKDLHMSLGGIWDCHVDLKAFSEKWPETELLLGRLALKAESLANALFMHRYLKCPLSCELGTKFEDCRCSCPIVDARGHELTWWESYDILDASEDYIPKVSHFLKSEGEVGPLGRLRYHFEGVSTEASQALWSMILDFGCHPGKFGNMCTGASAGDPIFWPIHPFFDRMWHWLRINKDGQFNHVSWKWIDNEDDCYGHRSYDAMPFYKLFMEDNNDPHFYTNAELFDKFNPQNPELPYVYDSFAWESCWSSGQPNIEIK